MNGTVVIGIDGDKPKKVRGKKKIATMCLFGVMGDVISCKYSRISEDEFRYLKNYLLMTLNMLQYGRDPLYQLKKIN